MDRVFIRGPQPKPALANWFAHEWCDNDSMASMRVRDDAFDWLRRLGGHQRRRRCDGRGLDHRIGSERRVHVA